MNGEKKKFPVLAVVFGIVDLLLLAALCYILFFSKGSIRTVKADVDSDFKANADTYGYDSEDKEYYPDKEISYDGSSVSGKEAETKDVSSSEGFIFPNSDKELISEDMMNSYLKDKATLRLAINEIYARHGYQFSNEEYQKYYGQYDWYNKLPKESDMDKVSASFSEIEKKNVDALQAYSKSHGWS